MKKTAVITFFWITFLSANFSSWAASQGVNMSSVANSACNKVLNARKQAGIRKKQSVMDMYRQTVGQKMEQLARNCKDQILKTKVGYINLDPWGIINSIFNAANQVCNNVGNKIQNIQNNIFSGFTKTLPFGIAQIGTTNVSADEISKKGWNPTITINGKEVK